MRIPPRAVLPPMAVMLCLGLWGLNRGTMWRDESATQQMAQRTLRQILRALGSVDAVHGLYYLLMHPVLAVRPSEVALRLPSVAAAVLATGLVAALGCRLARPRVGLWAGLLYAATPLISHYAQEGRSYALVAAGAVWATWLLVGAVEEPAGTGRPAGLAAAASVSGAAGGKPPGRGAGRWVGYGLVIAVTALLHLFAGLLLAAHALTLLASRAPRRVWRGWGLAAASAMAPLVPLALLARRQSGQVAWIPEPGPAGLWALAKDFAGPSGLVLAVNALLIAVAVARPLPPRPGSPSLTAVALPLLCAPPALLFALSQSDPLFLNRYLLFALAGVPLLAASGADRFATWATGHRGRRAVAAAGVMAIGVAFVVQLPPQQRVRGPHGRADNLAALAAELGRRTRAGDAVLYDPPYERRIALAYPRSLADRRDLALSVPGPASGTLYGVEVGPSELLRRLGTVDGAWLVAADGPKARRTKAAMLAGRFRLAYVLCLPGSRLERYVRGR
ncbi:glycosyltransferase family 39 protein [Streptomyces sp. NPDC005393]|uniref:glycosyltransferase family 39 protein n=1 Tax=Streptomyces sp. NPDC005393 TaxID=3157041 RepID=UPI0033A6FABD